MDKSKGFSLIEVVLSLLIISTLLLSLLELRWQAQLVLKRLALEVTALQTRDQQDEWLSAKQLSALS